MSDNMFLRLANTYNAVNEQWTKAAHELAKCIRLQKYWSEIHMDVDVVNDVVYVTGEYSCYGGTDTEGISMTIGDADRFLSSDASGRKAFIMALREKEDAQTAAEQAERVRKAAEELERKEREQYLKLHEKFGGTVGR